MSSQYSSNEYDPQNTNTTWHKMMGFIPENSHVLDVGCSSGNFGQALKKYRNTVVTGVDISKSDVEEAKQKLDKAFVLDIENQPSDKLEKYDVIVFADVLEHMKDPVAVLKKCGKHLNLKGRVVFSIPNMAHIFTRLELLQGSFRYTETGLLDYTHLHFYDETEVRRIFQESNMNIQQFDSPIFDYPDELIREKVENVGLKVTKKFLDMAHRPQAITFEYVGYADFSPAKRKVNLKTSSPLDEVYAFVERNTETYKEEVRTLKEKIKLSEIHIEKLENLLADARKSKITKAIDRVYKSKSKK